MKTSEVLSRWYVIDAKDLILGRLASRIAIILRGKDQPGYTPHVNCGANVIVVNAEKIGVTGRKLEQKSYYRHTGYIGGIKETSLRSVVEGRHPERALEKSVWGMLSRGPLAREQFKRLRVYSGPNHPHEAQKPIVLDVVALNDKNSKEGGMARKSIDVEIDEINADIGKVRTSIESVAKDSKVNTEKLSAIADDISAVKTSLTSIHDRQYHEHQDNTAFQREVIKFQKETTDFQNLTEAFQRSATEFQSRALGDLDEIRKNTADLADIRNSLKELVDIFKKGPDGPKNEEPK